MTCYIALMVFSIIYGFTVFVLNKCHHLFEDMGKDENAKGIQNVILVSSLLWMTAQLNYLLVIVIFFLGPACFLL